MVIIMPYTVSLIALKCEVSQEDNGDEIYVLLNGQRVWSVAGDYKMHQQPQKAHHIKEIDFVNGRWLLRDGWQAIPEFDPLDYIFTGQPLPGQFQIWYQDDFSRDDYLGHIPFSEREAGRGQISGVAAGDGANYILTYQLVLEDL